MRIRLLVCLFALGTARAVSAQERAYFVTYDHYLEEPRNLELAFATTSGFPKEGNTTYTAPWLEIEYGATGWWTTELYLEGVTAGADGSGFTGWRWENRFRPFKNEHRVNPVFYVEYESINEASRIQKEIVGSGSLPFEPIAELREEHAHELEGKLILSSAVRGWNIAENFAVEKNLSEDEGFEFGYAVGVSRSLGGLANGNECRWCRERFVVGVEAYGSLGTSEEAGLHETRHYLAPVLAWRLTPQTLVKVSNGFGLTAASDHNLLRFGFSYEFSLPGAR